MSALPAGWEWSSRPFLVSTCERLSVMHQPARLPENFHQISPKHPCSGILHRTTPPPKIKIVPRVQVQPYPETVPLPRKWKTLTFFSEFRSELTQNTPSTPPPVAVEVCGDCISQGYHLVTLVDVWFLFVSLQKENLCTIVYIQWR